MSTHALFFAPQELEVPILKENTIGRRVYDRIVSSGEAGVDTKTIAETLGLTLRQAKNGIAGIQARWRSLMVFYTKAPRSTVSFAAQRVLSHLRHEETTGADFCINWCASKTEDPFFPYKAAEKIVHELGHTPFRMSGPHYPPLEALRVCTTASDYLKIMFKNVSFDARVQLVGLPVPVVNVSLGAEVIRFRILPTRRVK